MVRKIEAVQPVERTDRPRSQRHLRGREKSSGGLLVAMTLIAAAYFVPRGVSWNADTHMFLTASIVDRGSLNIDPFARHTGDLAMVNGHFFADKAPGLSLLAVPFYALLKLVLLGGQPLSAVFAVPEAQRVDFLVRYLLAIVCAGVPTAVVTVLLYRFLPRLGIGERWSAGLALTYALGTIARPFAGQLFSHQLAAAFLFGAFIVLYRVRHGEMSARFVLLAGVLLGCAVITEYPTVLIAACLAIYALLASPPGQRGLRPHLRHGRSTLRPAACSFSVPSMSSVISLVNVWFSESQRATAVRLAAGAAPMLALGALYNTVAFGGPLSTGYAHLAGPQEFQAGQAQGFFGITFPHLDALWSTTIGPQRGVFLLSPVLLLAIPGFVALLRRMPAWRTESRLWLAIVSVYALFTISYYMWDGGYSIGPRDFLPALPFLMLPIAALLRPGADPRWRRAALILSAVSIAVVELATATGPLINPAFPSPLTDNYLPRLLAGTLDNNWGMLFGLPGALQLLPLALVLTLLYRAHWRRTSRHATLSPSDMSANASG